jgi:chloramphenicol 3-O-phosphotransferase
VSADVWLITGAQASGKSTIAELLAQHFARGVHVRGGQFYRWATTGWVHFDDADHAEARRLLDLRYRLSALVADEYAAAGFTTVVQDNIYGNDVVQWLRSVRARPLRLVVLRPRVSVVAERDEERRHSSGKVAYRGAFTAAENDAEVATTPAELGLWLDTSAQTPAETVRAILGRAGDASVA